MSNDGRKPTKLGSKQYCGELQGKSLFKPLETVTQNRATTNDSSCSSAPFGLQTVKVLITILRSSLYFPLTTVYDMGSKNPDILKRKTKKESNFAIISSK